MTRLYTTDTKALNHVLMNSYIYQKPEAARYNLSRVVGPGGYITLISSFYGLILVNAGVLVVEEDKHRQQVWRSCTDSQ